MIKVCVATTMGQKAPVLRDESTYTPAEAIREAGCTGVAGTWYINSSPLKPEQVNVPFADLGYGTATGRSLVNLTNIIKADNA